MFAALGVQSLALKRQSLLSLPKKTRRAGLGAELTQFCCWLWSSLGCLCCWELRKAGRREHSRITFLRRMWCYQEVVPSGGDGCVSWVAQPPVYTWELSMFAEGTTRTVAECLCGAQPLVLGFRERIFFFCPCGQMTVNYCCVNFGL